MINEIKISFIIPLYNSANSLKRCLDSIFEIRNVSYEIILIDDGSTDNTANLCKIYTDKFDNIKYIYQTNKGPGAARNEGIRLCSGEFIWFVDSDDIIISYKLFEIFESTDKFEVVDIINFNYIENNLHRNIKTKIKYNYECLYNKIIEGKKYVKDFIIPSYYNNGFLWNRLFRTEFIKKENIYFGSERYQEDFNFIIKAFSKTKKVLLLNEFHYEYGVRYNSKRRYYPDVLNDLNIVYNTLLEYIKEDKEEAIKNHVNVRWYNSVKYALIDNLYFSENSLSRKNKNIITKEIFYGDKVFLRLKKFDSESLKLKKDKWILKTIKNKSYNWFRIIRYGLITEQKIRNHIKRLIQ